MLFLWVWHLCDDGITRPVIRAEVETASGAWLKVPFLVDTGADRSVLDATSLHTIGLPHLPPQHILGGVGGSTTTVEVNTQIRLTDQRGAKITFRGRYAAFPEYAALDMSVFGRDIFQILTVIVDRQHDFVALIGQGHQYTIVAP